MAKSPKKNAPHISSKSAKAPGKTILPRNRFTQQRRFSLIDSDSSSALSECESEDEEPENHNQYNPGHHSYKGNKFHAIESESDDNDEEENGHQSNDNSNDDDDDDEEEDDDDDNSDSESTNEELWKNHSKKVVNTSSTSSEGENDSGSESDSSSSDDEDVDFVKLTAERKARHLEQFRSNSPFKSPSPVKNKISQEERDVDFSFDFNNDDHRLKIANEDEEEDVGEELSGVVSPMNKTSQLASIPGGDALAYPTIDDSSESDDDIDKDELLRTLEQDSDGVEGEFGNNEDEYNLLREEADNILHDYDGNSEMALSSTNATPRNSIVEEMINKHKAELNQEEVLQFVSDDEYADDDDDDYDEDDEYNEDFIIPFFDDTVFKEQLYTNGGNTAIGNKQNGKEKELDSDDDSYLWDYFFSSGDENDEEQEDNSNHFSDDEATDEDTTLPPPSSRKKVGTKAQELLSSSSVTARPPALGTWSTDSKPFGIIDGLSTRSLLPGQNRSGAGASSSSSNGVGALSGPSSSHLHPHRTDSPSTPISSGPNNNNIEELTLDELLNMSELEDDNDEELLNHDDWLEVTGSNRKVPLSAFRNKGIVNDTSHVNATRRFSSSNPSTSRKKLNKKSNRKMNEITMTPVRISNKHGAQKRRGSKLRRRQSMAEAAVEGLRATKSGLFSEDTLTNVEEFLSGLGSEAELSVLFREIQ